MKYYSLLNPKHRVTFEKAVIEGLAPDKGLYFPEEIKPLPVSFIKTINEKSNAEIAFETIKPFVKGEIPENDLQKMVSETIDFDFPLIDISDDISVLELYHGPTMAFKDVGARFMARCLGYFNRNRKEANVTVLVATSGDTGGAVAHGFLGVEGVDVVILYPSGKVSEIQEKQLTTLGQNIRALEVEGSFDDCQAMVKKAFVDENLKSFSLTSANSINVARWLPQMFYYFFAVKQLSVNELPLAVSVPSGNFGNICAGMVAQKLGLPIHHFIASTNVNDTVPNFLNTGLYEPKKSTPTISNAMDVGDPSNFVRILALFNEEVNELKNHFSSYSFNDEETRQAMNYLNEQYNYIADPHGAVGYLGLKKFLSANPNYRGLFLETAHPAKFLSEVEQTLKKKIKIPAQLSEVIGKEKHSIKIKNYADLVEVLLS